MGLVYIFVFILSLFLSLCIIWSCVFRFVFFYIGFYIIFWYYWKVCIYFRFILVMKRKCWIIVDLRIVCFYIILKVVFIFFSIGLNWYIIIYFVFYFILDVIFVIVYIRGWCVFIIRCCEIVNGWIFFCCWIYFLEIFFVNVVFEI